MKIGAQAAALGAIEQQKRLDVIANNLANTSTPGYKRDEVHFSDFLYQTSYTQREQGPIHMTNNPLDIALQGDGFFKVETDQGVVYSRAGNLTLNQENTLVTQDGWPVLGANGPIQVNSTNIRITEDGQVFDGETAVDTIALVKFPSETLMTKVQGGYLKPANAQDEPEAAQGCTVQQGSLEGANFTVVEEMAKMVDTLRMFEAYQKVLQTSTQDLDSKVISQLGG